MDAWAQVLIALLALGGPFLAYLLAVRKASGRIRATEASELWDEAGAIRRECAERVRVLEAQVKELQEENWRLIRASFGDGHA